MRVTVDDEGVHRAVDGAVESVRWDDLANVTIRTTDEGPFVEDVFWLLQREDGSGMVVPADADGFEGLLERLQKLPGFSNEAVILASASAENAWFVCWDRDGG